MSVRTSLLVPLLLGVSLEVLVTASSGRREAWDSTAYWDRRCAAGGACRRLDRLHGAGARLVIVAFAASRFRRGGSRQ
jgi:hypothetical protein